MERLFGEIPEALSNTVTIAERCAFDLEFDRLHLPTPDLPEGTVAHQHMSDLCWEGLRRRYPDEPTRLRVAWNMSCHVIEQTGFADYMLIVRDFAQFARSAASRLACAAQPLLGSSFTHSASPTSIRSRTASSSSAS